MLRKGRKFFALSSLDSHLVPASNVIPILTPLQLFRCTVLVIFCIDVAEGVDFQVAALNLKTMYTVWTACLSKRSSQPRCAAQAYSNGRQLSSVCNTNGKYFD